MKISRKELILIVAPWGMYFLVLWPKMLFWKEDGLYAGWIGVWADWAAHFSYASVFAYRSVTDWFIGHPLFAGRTQFSYPFLSDAISGLLIRSGVDVVLAFLIPSVVATLLLIVVLSYFYREFLGSARQALVATTLFFTSGGLGWWFFLQDVLDNPSLETFSFPPEQYTHIGPLFLEWINVVTGQIIPQRAFLLGLPVTLSILLLLLRWMRLGLARVWTGNLVLFGVIASALLLIHVHSYIVLLLLCTIFMLTRLAHWRQWLIVAAAAALPSALIFQWLYAQSFGQGFITWHPGWLAHPQSKDVNWLFFWWLNWGLFLPFSLFAVWRTRLYRHPLIIGGVVIFILANLFLFQPYDWDNSKLLTYSYLILCIPAAAYLAQLWGGRRHRGIFRLAIALGQKDTVRKGIVVTLFLSMTASGFLDLWRVLQTDKLLHRMWTREEGELAQRFREISMPTDRILISDQHNHWVSTQTGRPILLGYKGWMWTYGIDYTVTDRDMRAMFAGGPGAAQLLEQYNIQYVVIGPSEIHDYDANQHFFSEHYPIVMKNEPYAVYAIPDNLSR